MQNPIGELLGAYAELRSAVQAPNEYRAVISTPLRAVDAALGTADTLEAELQDAVDGIGDGRYSVDQARARRDTAVAKAEETVTALSRAEARLKELPNEFVSDAFPESLPKPTHDEGTLRDNIRNAFMGYRRPEDMLTGFVGFVSDAVAAGDLQTAKLLVSTFGKDTLASHLGRERVDDVWTGLRDAAIAEALPKARDGNVAVIAKARTAAAQAHKAFIAGLNAADMRVQEAKRKSQERFAQSRGRSSVAAPSQ